jgi:hypothetical protein
MWNIFEHWWTALLIAGIVQLVLAIIHVIKPESRKIWHIFVPLSIIIIGIGIEQMVQTDMEKIDTLIKQCLTFTADENINGIEAILAADYSDSCHNSKKIAIEYCRKWMSRPLIAQNKLFAPPDVAISNSIAQVNMIVVTHIDPKSNFYDSAKVLIVKARLFLERDANKRWLVQRAELLEINNQPIKWSDI